MIHVFAFMIIFYFRIFIPFDITPLKLLIMRLLINLINFLSLLIKPKTFIMIISSHLIPFFIFLAKQLPANILHTLSPIILIIIISILNS